MDYSVHKTLFDTIQFVMGNLGNNFNKIICSSIDRAHYQLNPMTKPQKL